jgi:hypothetical protein
MSTSRPPDLSNAFDMVELVFMMTAILFNFAVMCLYAVLRRRKQIPVTIPPWVAPVSWAVGTIHIVSVFVSYGFYADVLGPTILTPACSLWVFWLQYVLGFSAWVMILCMRLIGVAIITVTDFQENSPRRRLFFRLGCAVVILLPMVFIGSIAEATGSAFYPSDNGTDCNTEAAVKIVIFIWLVVICSVFIVCSIYVKRRSVLASDVATIVEVEMAIAKVSGPILVICSILNFSALVSYWWGRGLFLALIVVMHTWSCWHMYGNHVFSYKWSRTRCGEWILIRVCHRKRRRVRGEVDGAVQFLGSEDDYDSDQESVFEHTGSGEGSLFDFGTTGRHASSVIEHFSRDTDSSEGMLINETHDGLCERSRARKRIVDDKSVFTTFVEFVLDSDKKARSSDPSGDGLTIQYSMSVEEDVSLDVSTGMSSSSANASSSKAPSKSNRSSSSLEEDEEDNSADTETDSGGGGGGGGGADIELKSILSGNITSAIRKSNTGKTVDVNVTEWCTCLKDILNVVQRYDDSLISEQESVNSVLEVFNRFVMDTSSVLETQSVTVKRSSVRPTRKDRNSAKDRRRWSLYILRYHPSIVDAMMYSSEAQIRSNPGCFIENVRTTFVFMKNIVIDQFFDLWYKRGGYTRLQDAIRARAEAVEALKLDSFMCNPFYDKEQLMVDDN